jgi:hypothetical protein
MTAEEMRQLPPTLTAEQAIELVAQWKTVGEPTIVPLEEVVGVRMA